MVPPTRLSTSPATVESLVVQTDTLPPEATSENTTMVQQVLSGLSQIPPTILGQVVPSIEKIEESDENLGGLSTIRADTVNEVPPQAQLEAAPGTSITTVRAHTPSFAAWSKRVLKKKQRANSESRSSNFSVPKRRSLFGLREEVKLLGSIGNPVLLPLVHNTPFVGQLSNTSLEQIPRRQIQEKRVIEYHGIRSLLDCNGCPRSFPAQAQTIIEKQQKSYKASCISRDAFDRNFDESMVNDEKEKIDQRGFSSTGANFREAAARPVEEAKVSSIHGVTKATEGELTCSERVLGSYGLLEMILLQIGQNASRATILRARGVNKAFAQVIRRSAKLQRMLSGK